MAKKSTIKTTKKNIPKKTIKKSKSTISKKKTTTKTHISKSTPKVKKIIKNKYTKKSIPKTTPINPKRTEKTKQVKIADIEPIVVETKAPVKTNHVKTLSILGLLGNMFVWPGLGTAIGGDHHKGALQMLCTPSIIMIVLIILSYTRSPLSFVVGGILFFFVWIWGIVSSFHQIADAFQ